MAALDIKRAVIKKYADQSELPPTVDQMTLSEDDVPEYAGRMARGVIEVRHFVLIF
jgi:hypothetical protein